MFAIATGKTQTLWLSQISELYSLIKMGVAVDYASLTSEQVRGLLFIEKEVQRKAEVDAKLNKMRRK
jgi:hypothetical protein